MSMGGGTGMLKTVGRVIGGGGGRSASLSWKSTPHSCRRASASSSSSVACEHEEGEMWATNPGWGDWELMGDEIAALNCSQQKSIDRTVFGIKPTEKEVEGAISYLQDAIPQSVNASEGKFPGSEDYETSVQKSNHLAGVAASPESNIESCKDVVDWIEPDFHPGIHGVVQPLEHNYVLDAFKLLKNDTVVQVVGCAHMILSFLKTLSSTCVTFLIQCMVKSLASDKAIWDAVLKNEKVIEFRKSLQNGEPKLDDISKGSDNACDSNKPTIFTLAFDNVKLKVTEYMEKITELIYQILGITDKKIFAGKDVDILDRTIKSSLMLTVVVLLVVLVNRGQKV